MMRVDSFYYSGASYSFPKEISSWFHRCANHLHLYDGHITFIFCNDVELLELNRRYLSHDFLTDILTFDLRKEASEFIFADIFISLERVQENALLHGVDYHDELKRVLIHGILHLCGYNDKYPKETVAMRTVEDLLIPI